MEAPEGHDGCAFLRKSRVIGMLGVFDRCIRWGLSLPSVRQIFAWKEMTVVEEGVWGSGRGWRMTQKRIESEEKSNGKRKESKRKVFCVGPLEANTATSP